MDTRAIILARQAQHHRVADRGMLDQRGLDFRRINVGAAAQDHVGSPIRQEQIAILVEIPEIAESLPDDIAEPDGVLDEDLGEEDPARELQSLAVRMQALLGDPALDGTEIGQALAPLIELYHSRFPRVATETESPSEPAQSDGGDGAARVVAEYRALVGRLEAEESLLHDTLLKMYDYINQEMAARTQGLLD